MAFPNASSNAGNPADELILGHDPGSRTVRSTCARNAPIATAGGITSGTLRVTPIVLFNGDVISYLTYRSNTTAATTPANYWFALYDDQATPALLAQTADQLTTAWGANTTKNLQLTTTITIPRSGIYFTAIMVAAAATPTIDSVTSNAMNALLSFHKVGGNTSNTGLTGTAPATLGTITASATNPFCVASSAI